MNEDVRRAIVQCATYCVCSMALRDMLNQERGHGEHVDRLANYAQQASSEAFRLAAAP